MYPLHQIEEHNNIIRHRNVCNANNLILNGENYSEINVHKKSYWWLFEKIMCNFLSLEQINQVFQLEEYEEEKDQEYESEIRNPKVNEISLKHTKLNYDILFNMFSDIRRVKNLKSLKLLSNELIS